MTSIDVIGMKLEDFEKLKLNYRIINKSSASGCDFNPDRYNIKVRDGIIISCTKG
jgi:hypothetical protein